MEFVNLVVSTFRNRFILKIIFLNKMGVCMIRFRVETLNKSVYFNEEEKDLANKYFDHRVNLRIPCSFWVVHSSLYGDVQLCLRKFEV